MHEFSQSVYYDFSGPSFLLIKAVSEQLIFSFANPLAYQCTVMVTNAETGINLIIATLFLLLHLIIKVYEKCDYELNLNQAYAVSSAWFFSKIINEVKVLLTFSRLLSKMTFQLPRHTNDFPNSSYY